VQQRAAARHGPDLTATLQKSGTPDAVLAARRAKRLLRGKGMTYAAVAQGLDISEASVKRMFSRRDFTLQWLEEVCRVAGPSSLANRKTADAGTVVVVI